MSFWGSVCPSLCWCCALGCPREREDSAAAPPINLCLSAVSVPVLTHQERHRESRSQSDLPQPSYLLPSPSTLSTLKYPFPCGPKLTSPFITLPYSTAWVSGSGRACTCPGLGCRRKLEGKEPRDPGESVLKSPAGHRGLRLVRGKLSPVGGEWLHHMLMWARFPSCVRRQGRAPTLADSSQPQASFGLRTSRTSFTIIPNALP